MDRQKVIQFIKSFNPYGTKFILKKPSISFIENIFLMTFTKEVWIASLTVLTVFGIVLYGLLNWETENNLNVSDKILLHILKYLFLTTVKPLSRRMIIQ